MYEPAEREYLAAARVGRLATADGDGRPHVVPICFALLDGEIYSPIDEKPKSADPRALRRSRDVRENPRVALVVDHYTETWADLGWVQVRGRAQLCSPDAAVHAAAVDALREKYDQYDDHALGERPILRIAPDAVRSWGSLDGDG